MLNNILLLASVPLIYGTVLIFYRLFGHVGMYAMTVIATIFANIEVIIMIKAFGLDMTLGNVLFASTYLVTDILSECEGEKSARLSVWLGSCTALVMVIFTQYTLLYIPSEADTAFAGVASTFSQTPRLLVASFISYIIPQRLDVFLYNLIWKKTSAASGDKKRFLWLRNNCATLISQALNAILFNAVAFIGVMDMQTLISVIISSYIIYIFTSLLDTPFVYIARLMKTKNLDGIKRITAND